MTNALFFGVRFSFHVKKPDKLSGLYFIREIAFLFDKPAHRLDVRQAFWTLQRQQEKE